MSRITIFSGRFGSGKTETALNYAVALASSTFQVSSSRFHLTDEDSTQTATRHTPHAIRHTSDAPVALVDLDIVTPYFRSREMALGMKNHHVEVIAPMAVSLHLDLPAISPQILGTLQNDGYRVVLDVGGDPQGARALGQFSSAIQSAGYTMLMLVNPYRPFTDTEQGIGASIQEIETTSRLTVSGLVSNPNLMEETTPDILERGHALVEATSQRLALPIEFIVMERSLAAAFPEGHFRQPVLPITRHFTAPWGLVG